MTKSIVLSIQAQHAYNIMDGYKTLELRKRVPRGFKGWVYVYVTKAEPYLYQSRYNLNYFLKQYKMEAIEPELRPELLNGTIPFRFWFDEWEEVIEDHWINQNAYSYSLKNHTNNDDLLKNSCLTLEEIYSYLGMNNGCAWHIKKLEIFDKPMQLGDFNKYLSQYKLNMLFQLDLPMWIKLSKAPQSYQYVYLKGEL